MHRESGQAAVEAALVLPLWLGIALGAMQLALLQQARLLTEYGAYAAVRAGVVWSGNNERMRDAALLAILPSHGAASTLEALGRSYQRLREEDRAVHDALAPRLPAPVALKQSGLLGLVRVELLSPQSLPSGAEEQDFDDPEAAPDDTILTIRLRYLYELRLPFANQLLFAAWFAQRASSWEGAPALPPEEVEFLRASAAGEGPLPGHRYFIPLRVTWSQRLQSNLHRKWLEAQ